MCPLNYELDYVFQSETLLLTTFPPLLRRPVVTAQLVVAAPVVNAPVVTRGERSGHDKLHFVSFFYRHTCF